MTTTSSGYVGVDVSKDTLDVAVLGQQRVRQYANTQVGIAELRKAMGQLAPALIVVEATGGYERAAVLGLFEAGLPVARVSANRVRQYARAAAGQDRSVGCHEPGRVRQTRPAASVRGQK